MTNSTSLQIIKVPLSKSRMLPHTPQFPKMPKLYMELFENKDKIKQEFVNKEEDNLEGLNHDNLMFQQLQNLDKLSEPVKPSFQPHEMEDSSDHSETPSFYGNDKPKPLPPRFPKYEEDHDSDSESGSTNGSGGSISIHSEHSDSDYSDDQTNEPPFPIEHIQPRKASSLPREQYNPFTPKDNNDYHDRREERPRQDYHSHREERPDYHNRREEKPNYHSRRGYDEPKPRFETRGGSQEPSFFGDTQNRPSSQFHPPHQSHQPEVKQPHMPSLSELNMNEKHIPNISYSKKNLDEENKKRELLFRFDLLRKKYKNAHVPEFNMITPYDEMNRAYEMTVKNLVIESSSESYKTYLFGAFMAVEYMLGGWMGFDMQGFTQQQIASMSSYERLLIELGEKSYVDEESQWPVEVRLLGLILTNAAFFILSRMMTKKTGSNIINIINSMNTAPAPQTTGRKMKGPNINFDDLPSL